MLVWCLYARVKLQAAYQREASKGLSEGVERDCPRNDMMCTSRCPIKQVSLFACFVEYDVDVTFFPVRTPLTVH